MPPKRGTKRTASAALNEEESAADTTEEFISQSNVESEDNAYLTCTEGGSDKFYEIKRSDMTVLCRYGKMNSVGVTTMKTFDSIQDLKKFITKTIAEKEKKGYVLHIMKASPLIVPAEPEKIEVVKSMPSESLPEAFIEINNTSIQDDTSNSKTYMEYRDSSSDKFYELIQNGTKVSIRYGKRNTPGVYSEKDFSDKEEALKFVTKTANDKRKKGYQDINVANIESTSIPTMNANLLEESEDPLSDLEAGKKVSIQGSSAMPYTLKKFNGGYSCSCPGFIMQIKKNGIQASSCKHLKQVRGVEAESLRCQDNKGVVVDPSSKANKNASIIENITLAHPWKPTIDPTGFIMSEKLDGMRAYWSDSKLWSRSGIPIIAPDWFISHLPKEIELDGELFLGRKMFDECMSIARRTDASDEWRRLSYVVFDAPKSAGGIRERLEVARISVGSDNPYCHIHPYQICNGIDHLLDELAKVEQVGGEGLMIRHPTASHRGGRTNDLLKVKSFNDAEAIVTGFEAGKGKYQGMLGSLVCSSRTGAVFKCGSGLTDNQRSLSCPFVPIGTIITFKYFELTKDGIPRFPTFLRARADLDSKEWPQCF